MKKKIDPIGPQTKRESKKSDRKSKVLTPMAAPKIKRTIETPESKAAKKKERMKTAATVAGVVGTAVGGILTDIRYQRGARRVRGTSSNKDVPFGQGYRAGKNKKSTKK